MVINRSILHFHAHYRCFVFIIVLKTMLKSVSNLQCIHHSCLNFKFVKGLHLPIASCVEVFSCIIHHTQKVSNFIVIFKPIYNTVTEFTICFLSFAIQLPGNWCWQDSHLQPKLSDTLHICFFFFLHYPLFSLWNTCKT